MGLYQQARILLLHHGRMRWSHNGRYRSPDPEIYGRGADPQDPYDIPRYVADGESWLLRQLLDRGEGNMEKEDGLLICYSTKGTTAETDGLR